ncbi:hypothetical protein VPH35_039241 [Triticum aestivum]
MGELNIEGLTKFIHPWELLIGLELQPKVEDKCKYYRKPNGEEHPPPALHTAEAAQATASATVGKGNRPTRFSGAAASSSSQGVGRAVQPFSSDHVDFLVERKKWDDLEAYLMQYMATLQPLQTHPMVFLRIRMSRVIDMIDQNKFADAEVYFRDQMVSMFQKLIEQGPGTLRNASISSLSDGLKSHHPYTSSLMTKLVVNDYMRLYLPKEIEYKNPRKRDGLWAFAFSLESKSATKPTFRCLACSLKVFSSATIQDIRLHLEQCPGMTSPYVTELFEYFNTIKNLSAGNQPAQLAKAAGKRQRVDSTAAAGNSFNADRQYSFPDLQREVCEILYSNLGVGEVQGAEELFTEIDNEVHEVVDMYNDMGTKVGTILGLFDRLRPKFKKMKGLACAGHSGVPSVAAVTHLFATEPVSTRDDEGAHDTPANNAIVDETKAVSATQVQSDGNCFSDEVMSIHEIPRSASDPVYELADVEEVCGFFVGGFH